MTKQRKEEGFAHNPDAIDGVETRVTRHADGDVSVSFGDGSENLNVSRREFMRISGVAAATAAMAGTACRNPVETIVPFVDRPEEIRVGTPNHYATICTACPAQCGAVVTTRGGRPVKLDGNKKHPVSKGALCARGQASYLDLYDPDRAQGPLEVAEGGAHRKMTWEEVDRDVAAEIDKARSGGGIALLTRTVSGSGRQALLDEVTKSISNARHYTYEPFNSEALLAASELAYGDRHVPHYRFDEADLVVSLGSDFLGTWLSPVEFTAQFSSRRDPEGNFNKLVVFEGNMSLTGMNADDRFRVRPSDLPAVAYALANEVVVVRKSGALATDPRIINALKPFTIDAVASSTGIPAEALKATADALIEARGKSIVVSGGLGSAVPGGLGLETAVAVLNATLGNVGRTVERARASKQAQGSLADIRALIADIEAGKVDMLIIDGANPVYHLPDSLGFAKALESVKFVVSTSDRVDETSKFANILAAGAHSLEAWGDSEAYEGVFSIQQPVISSLHDTRAFEDSLLIWFGRANAVPSLAGFLAKPEETSTTPRGPKVPTDPGAWYRFLRNHWEKAIFPKARSLAGFDRFWNDILRQGVFVVPGTEQNRSVSFDGGKAVTAFPKALPERKAAGKGLDAKELQLMPTIGLYDGSQANNGHLQELPDPVTKMVWGSYVQVSPKTFKDNSLELGQHVELTVNGKTRTFPVFLQPGLHDDVIAVPLGYGRSEAGVVGNEVGANTFLFSQIAEDRQIFGGIAIEAAKALNTGEKLATVQGADIIDLHRRGLFGKASLEDYKKNPEAGIHAHPPLPDLWEAHNYSVRWGMAIDLSKCTGCSACVVACQEENNVPVVGKSGVLEGREMHWLRIDRYFELPYEAAKLQKSSTSDPMFHRDPVVAFADYLEEPRVVWQPMMCQHCENAPCETVCPVSATMHSSDGLNQMVYNRCVGTRYCANNCPFKVRRFNWYNYSQDRSDSFFARLYPELKEHARLNIAEPLGKGMNPEVTVRSRGVMEKCTFCVQRIRRAKWQLRKENRTEYRDGDVVTACQEACPAGAIAFGNLADENSAVSKLHVSKRAHTPLKDIGVGSSVAYLTRVLNSDRDNAHHEAPHGEHADGAAEPAEAAH